MKGSTVESKMTSRTRNIALVSIIVLTAGLWSGVAGIHLNGDDYQYLPTLAPINNFADVLRPFAVVDANPSYFRPVANVTMSLDFLIFGWSGTAFHLTNLLMHLVATAIVFFFVRNLFRMSERDALWVTLVFGLAASHEYNLVVDTARADILSTIFVMLALLLAKRSKDEYSIPIAVGALTSFALALLSKESSILALPILAIVFFRSRTKNDLMTTAVNLLPYAILVLLFYFYHQHFTTSIADSEPLSAEGAHSLFAFIRNIIYSVGYFLLPLDLSAATTLLTQYHAVVTLFGVMVALLSFWFLFRSRNTGVIRELVGPFLFTSITGVLLALTFERWRLYLPSVGAIAMLAIIVRNTARHFGRYMWIILLLPLGSFHVYRALSAESEWRSSTAMLDNLKSHLSDMLAKIPERPLRIGFLAVPAKIGSASVMLLGKTSLLTRAEADRVSALNRETASTDGAKVDSWSAVDVYALNRSEGFRGLEIKQIAPSKYLVSVPNRSDIALYPANLTTNAAVRRDNGMHVGDTIADSRFVDIVRSVSFGISKSIEVQVLDTSALLMSFNGQSFEVTRSNSPLFIAAHR